MEDVMKSGWVLCEWRVFEFELGRFGKQELLSADFSSSSRSSVPPFPVDHIFRSARIVRASNSECKAATIVLCREVSSKTKSSLPQVTAPLHQCRKGELTYVMTSESRGKCRYIYICKHRSHGWRFQYSR